MRCPFVSIILLFAALACSMPAAQKIAGSVSSQTVPGGGNAQTLTPTSAPGNLIVYTCFPEGFDQICLMNADGSDQRRLTNDKVTDYYPTLAPGGKFIVFSSNRGGDFDLYRMEIDGSGVTQLTHKMGENVAPAVSPDGARIAFVSTANGNEDIWIMNADGSNPVRLTGGRSRELDPSWSPDGSQIAYTTNFTGDAELFIMDANGKNPRQVTNGSNQRDGGRNDWSPDGKVLAFYAGLKGKKQIFLVPVECAKQERGCGPDKFTQVTTQGNNKAPSFSSDGQWIVFASGAEGDDRNNNIFIIKPDGSGLTQLTKEAYPEYQPRWAR